MQREHPIEPRELQHAQDARVRIRERQRAAEALPGRVAPNQRTDAAAVEISHVNQVDDQAPLPLFVERLDLMLERLGRATGYQSLLRRQHERPACHLCKEEATEL